METMRLFCAGLAILSFSTAAFSQYENESDEIKKFYATYIVQYQETGNNFFLSMASYAASKNIALINFYEKLSVNDSKLLSHVGKAYYLTGNKVEAFKKYEASGKSGHSDGYSEIASIYLNGDDFIEKDELKACQNYENAVRLSSTAVFDKIELGVCLDPAYNRAPKFRKNLTEACDQINKGGVEAATIYGSGERNSALDYYSYGRAFLLNSFCYENEKYGRKDLKKVGEFLKLASTTKHPYANYRYGLILEDGLGVVKDEAQAFVYIKKSAELGSDVAQNKIGIMYAQGTGTKINIQESYKWFLISAANGYENAVSNRDKAETKLTKDQVILMKRQAGKFVAN